MWPLGRSGHPEAPHSSAACPAYFPQLWHAFVATFVDVLHAQGPAAPRPASAAPPPPPPLVLPAVPRLVAIGDLHGDLDKARRAFRLAGLVDEKDRWTGGTTTVVQVGDLLDRGDAELALLFWMERLSRQAAAAGGALHVLTGNHETMNVAGQYRYVTRGAMHSFKDWLHSHTLEAALKARCGCASSAAGLRSLLRTLRDAEHGVVGPHHSHPANPAAAARTAALQPGGEVTRRFLAPNPVVLQVGSTLFAHGGVLSQHVEHGLERINRETQDWMLHGRAEAKPKFLSGRTAIVWSRLYSAHDAARCDCEQLASVLGRVPGAQRMVVGHTIQEGGINSACEGQVLRIDVGLSRGCGDGVPQVLEILDDSRVRRLSEVQQENVAPASKASLAAEEVAAAAAAAAQPAAAEKAAQLKQEKAASAKAGQQQEAQGAGEPGAAAVGLAGAMGAAGAARPAAVPLHARQQQPT